MTHLPLFRSRSRNCGMRCMSFYILNSNGKKISRYCSLMIHITTERIKKYERTLVNWLVINLVTLDYYYFFSCMLNVSRIYEDDRVPFGSTTS